MFFKKTLIRLPLFFFPLLTGQALAFDIYGFIPYQSKVEAGRLVKGRPSQEWFSAMGIKPIDVIYENRLLDFPEGRARALATLSTDKIIGIASPNTGNGAQLVSLDLESWDRNAPDTPGKILQTIEKYRKAHPKSVIGLYATVPQNTYGWKSQNRDSYDSLNKKYSEVAEAVDYFSPSLYNYSIDDFDSWKEAAAYNIKAARNYSASKKVIPYITPEVSEKGVTRWLSYDEMMQRLKILKSLGADGCIVWTSSSARDLTGALPTLDPTSGWLKAVYDFGKNSG